MTPERLKEIRDRHTWLTTNQTAGMAIQRLGNYTTTTVAEVIALITDVGELLNEIETPTE